MSFNAKPYLFYQSVLKDGTGLVSSSTDPDPDFNIVNITDYRQGKLWKASSSGGETIKVDAGSAVPVDSLFFLNHNLNTAGAQVRIQKSATGEYGGEEVTVLTFTPADDNAQFKTFTQTSERYWRIVMDGPTVAPYLGVVLLGARLEMERWINGDFAPKPQRAKGETNTDANGLFINSVVASRNINLNVPFVNLTPSWVASDLQVAIDDHLILGLPFLWVWDYVNHATELYYVRVPIGSVLGPIFNRSRQSFTLPMIGVLE